LRTWCLEEGQEFSAHARDFGHECADLEMKIGHLGTVVDYLIDLDLKLSGPRLGWLLLAFSCFLIRQFWS
jgi:hypothetical protein